MVDNAQGDICRYYGETKPVNDLAMAEGRNGAQPVPVARCPRCRSAEVTVERARRPFTDSLVCEACNYVGPVKSKAEHATRSPAPPFAGCRG